MARYIVTYDLSAPGRDYPKLYNRINQYPSIRITESSWAFVSTATAAQLRDYFKEAIDSNDNLF